MADRKITDLGNAAALAGTELVEIIQAGDNVKTTAQTIANLGAAGAKIARGILESGETVRAGSLGIDSWGYTGADGIFQVSFTPGWFASAPSVALTMLVVSGDYTFTIVDDPGEAMPLTADQVFFRIVNAIGGTVVAATVMIVAVGEAGPP